MFSQQTRNCETSIQDSAKGEIMKKTLIALSFIAVPGLAFAAPETRCLPNPFGIETMGDALKAINQNVGNPGQNNLGLTASEFAHLRNDGRKDLCPPPGRS